MAKVKNKKKTMYIVCNKKLKNCVMEKLLKIREYGMIIYKSVKFCKIYTIIR